MKVKKHIISVFNPSDIYAAAGTEVKLISIHGHVGIYEDNNKNRFPVLMEHVTDDDEAAIADNTQSPPITTAYAKQTKQKKAMKDSAVSQINLF